MPEVGRQRNGRNWKTPISADDHRLDRGLRRAYRAPNEH
ncbi:MAG: hypothetical protein AVDCRST_MAG93-9091 [uncultured Chloroflexia bacterium]|uniref:Uncharacterized protein n=1 Tax=uncultured Chloroflexia bacterium TaxID=1672391 RepID=A0A6J4NAL8_9CHLR|nr:MAG: hypothetical protein AVDCRST_MAG93-9091 [uncultured Chloroflexia bacterium]